MAGEMFHEETQGSVQHDKYFRYFNCFIIVYL